MFKRVFEIRISVLILILGITLFGCSKRIYKIEKDPVEATFYEVFTKVVDSLHYNFQLSPMILPPPDRLRAYGFEIKEGANGYDEAYAAYKKSKLYRKHQKAWKQRNDSIRRDTTTYYILVQDSAVFNLLEILEPPIHRTTPVNPDYEIQTVLVDTARLVTYHKYIRFLYGSDHEKVSRDYHLRQKNRIVASVYFSTIEFDREAGKLICIFSYVRGPLDGTGHKIYFKRNRYRQWVFDKIVLQWIS